VGFGKKRVGMPADRSGGMLDEVTWVRWQKGKGGMASRLRFWEEDIREISCPGEGDRNRRRGCGKKDVLVWPERRCGKGKGSPTSSGLLGKGGVWGGEDPFTT